MNVGELKKLLEPVEDDREVIIPSKMALSLYFNGKLIHAVGPISHINIKSAAPGLDWEAPHMFILFPEHDLRYDLEK
jgi:hypothetical protein